MCTDIHTHMCIHIDVHVQLYIYKERERERERHIHVLVYTYICIHVYMCMCVCVCHSVWVSPCVCAWLVYVHFHACAYVCMSEHICVYTVCIDRRTTYVYVFTSHMGVSQKTGAQCRPKIVGAYGHPHKERPFVETAVNTSHLSPPQLAASIPGLSASSADRLGPTWRLRQLN